MTDGAKYFPLSTWRGGERADDCLPRREVAPNRHGARDEGRGREAAEGLQSEGTNAHFIRLDVTSQNTIDQAARRIEEDF
jgi:NAD(P)-dependent dehydrogenase (short-subunit alcohol dehydrogenase family)